MKSVLLSIQPKWCELIANGKKTIEVRKTRPKLEPPFKCYIYETKGLCDTPTFIDESGYISYRGRGQVIGEFVCDEIHTLIGQLSKTHTPSDKEVVERATCLTLHEITEYLKPKNDGFGMGYGWHISDLVIYDKPKELGEFYVTDMNAVMSCKYRERIYVNPDFVNGAKIKGGYICDKDDTNWCRKCLLKPLTRPPQSWCYVEELV